MFSFMIAICSGCCVNTRFASSLTSDETANIETVLSIKNSTVALVEGKKSNRTPYCAGVWVKDKKILTAGHCVENAGRIHNSISPEENYDPVDDIIMFVNYSDAKDEELPQDKVWFGVVEKFDNNLDLAIIRPLEETSEHQIAKIVDVDSVISGQTLHIVGHTVGMTWSYIKGYTSNSRTVKGLGDLEIKTIQVSSSAWMGNSGGGAFNSQGHLLGICSWINTRAPNLSFFIHHDAIINFLKEPLPK